MRDLAREGRTMLVVTHEIRFAAEVGTRMVFMDGGKIVEDGDPRQMVANAQSERARQFLSSVQPVEARQPRQDGAARDGPAGLRGAARQDRAGRAATRRLARRDQGRRKLRHQPHAGPRGVLAPRRGRFRPRRAAGRHVRRAHQHPRRLRQPVRARNARMPRHGRRRSGRGRPIWPPCTPCWTSKMRRCATATSPASSPSTTPCTEC